MEAQLIITGLWLTSLILTGKNAPLVLDPPTILCLLLGLHWWAMGGRKLQQAGSSERYIQLFYLMGLCLALILTIGTHFTLINQPLALFLVAFVVIWCWQRGMKRAQPNHRDEQAKTIFQRALFVMLVIVVLAAVTPSVGAKLLPLLTLTLPLFFLSGLITFSLLRLQTTGLAYRRRIANERRANPTRLWSIFVTLLCTGMVVLIFLGESVVFPLLTAIMSPFLTLLAQGVMTINIFFNALLQEKPTPPVRLPEKIIVYKSPPQTAFHSSTLLMILTLIAVAIIGFLIVIAIKIWYSNYRYAQEDEMRRGIAPLAVLKERRWKRVSVARDLLDPTSVRAQYREFLRLMARSNLERLPHETPLEYEARLYALLEILSHQQQVSIPATILDELTQAYIQERYGGKPMDDYPYTDWQRRIRRFVVRFRQLSRKHKPLPE